MPTVSIYVSNEDYDKFRAIEKKSEFIHNALNWGELKEPARAAVQPKTDGGVAISKVTQVHSNGQPVIKTKEDAVEAVKQLFPDAEVVTPLFRDKKNNKL